MSKFKRIGGRYGFHSGSGRFKNLEVDQSMFFQGSTLGQGCQGTIYYVDKTRDASGDGKSWDHAFTTVTAGLAALSNYDWLIIGPGNYDETDVMTLTGVKGVKILGYNTGMQWGEGSTNIRNASATTKDILYLTGCQGIEIAGIGFVVTTAKDAINFTGMVYSAHIHDCCFTSSAANALYAIDTLNNSADLYVHDCKFVHFVTAAIYQLSQRAVITNNVFIVPDSGKGILEVDRGSGFNIITDNYFLGADSSDYGIYSSTGTAGNFLIARNIFANFPSDDEIFIATGADENTVENLADSSGGAVEQVDPESGA